MKSVLFGFFLFFHCNVTSAQSFYDINVETTTGERFSFSKLKDHKVLFLVSDKNNKLNNSIIKEIKAQCPTIAIVNLIYQDKSSENENIDIRFKRYDSVSLLSILIAKKRDTLNSYVLNWLSSKDLNHHFNVNNVQSGHKFIVNEFGELYAVLPKEFNLQNKMFITILNKVN